MARLSTSLGESPVWDVDHQVLHLVDVLAGCVHRVRPSDGSVETMSVAGVPGAIALRTRGGYVAAMDLGFARIGLDGSVERLATVPAGDRMNDGKCDPAGRFLAGTMDHDECRGAASLYRLDPDGTVTEVLGDVSLSNGLDWSPSGDTLYYVDTTLERVDQFAYDLSSGQLAERRPFADLREVAGRPDGLTVDTEGGVWVVVARAGRIQRYDPDGRLTEIVELPTSHVTSCTFGGAGLDELFVTSARALLAEPARSRDPLAGALFVVTGLGVGGPAPTRFLG